MWALSLIKDNNNNNNNNNITHWLISPPLSRVASFWSCSSNLLCLCKLLPSCMQQGDVLRPALLMITHIPLNYSKIATDNYVLCNLSNHGQITRSIFLLRTCPLSTNNHECKCIALLFLIDLFEINIINWLTSVANSHWRQSSHREYNN